MSKTHAPTPMHRAMLDLVSVGARLNREGKHDSGAILLHEDDAAEMEQMLRDLGAEQKGHELALVLDEGSKMRVAIRLDRHGSTNKFLNFSGNPLSFLTGNNIYGSPNVEKSIVGTITKCLQLMEERSGHEVPKRVWRDVEKRDIHLLMLEFATYTRKLPDKSRMLNRWHYMYRRATIWSEEKQENVFLDEVLGLQHINTEFKSSFCLKKMTGGKDRRTILQMMFYDKQEEILKNRPEGDTYLGDPDDEESDEYVPEDIRDRLRLEISLHKPWLKNKNIATLADLIRYVEKKHDGKWKRLIRAEANKVMDQACLVKMFTFDGEKVIKSFEKGKPYVEGLGREIPTEAWIAMLEARMEHGMTTKLKVSKIRGTEPYRLFLHKAAKRMHMDEVEGLQLDMRRVQIKVKAKG